MKFLQSLCVGIVLSLAVACDSTSNISSSGLEKPNKFPILRATGYAVISKQPGPTVDEKTLQAMRASKIDAYREIAEQVYGQQIIADTELRDTVQLKNNLKARTAGIVKGARVIRSYPVNDTYVTEIELDSKVAYDVYRMRTAL
ncbi:MAG: LPP20 family lipoprotein [Succinivibrionaceae bacterium]